MRGHSVVDKTLIDLLEIGENDLIAFCDDPKNRKILGTLSDELAHLATVAAPRGAYITMRHGCGCGDQHHDSAKKRMEKVRTKVLFENKNGDIIGKYMSAETYHAISLLEPATPADYATHGELQDAPETFHGGNVSKQMLVTV